MKITLQKLFCVCAAFLLRAFEKSNDRSTPHDEIGPLDTLKVVSLIVQVTDVGCIGVKVKSK